MTGVQGFAPVFASSLFTPCVNFISNYVAFLVCFYFRYVVRLRNLYKVYFALLLWGFGGFPRKGLAFM